MTVAELIKALSAYPPDMRVLMDDNNGWYAEIDQVVGPIIADGEVFDESEWSLPTIMCGVGFDSRSL